MKRNHLLLLAAVGVGLYFVSTRSRAATPRALPAPNFVAPRAVPIATNSRAAAWAQLEDELRRGDPSGMFWI